MRRTSCILALLALATACTSEVSLPTGVNPGQPVSTPTASFKGSVELGTVLGGDHAVLVLVGNPKLDTLAGFEWFATPSDRSNSVNRLLAAREFYPYVILSPGSTYTTYLRWRPAVDSAWKFVDITYARNTGGSWPAKGSFTEVP